MLTCCSLMPKVLAELKPIARCPDTITNHKKLMDASVRLGDLMKDVQRVVLNLHSQLLEGRQTLQLYKCVMITQYK